MSELFLRATYYLKSNKYFLLAMLVSLAVGIGIIFYINSVKIETPSDSSTVAVPKESEIVVIAVEGTVEIDKESKGEWAAVAPEATLSENIVLRTGEGSSAILMGPAGDLLVLDQNSAVKFTLIGSSEITAEQIYGKTYSVVEKQDGKTYSITKDEAKITALGTEFLVDMPKDSDSLSILVFISNVMLEQGTLKQEIAELNKASLNIKTNQCTNSLLTDTEKETNKPFLALIEKSQGIISVKKEAIAVRRAANNSNSVTTTTGNTNNSGSNSNSNGTNSTNGNSAPAPNPPAPTIYGKYNATSVEGIVNSLVLAYDDATGDWTNPGSGYPPAGVFHYGPVDQDNTYMGIRDGRLYVKTTLGGTIPTSRTTVVNDIIESLAWNIIIDTDGNTNNNCFGSEKAIAFNIAYHENGQIWYNAYGWSACQGTTYDGFQPNISGTFHTYNSGIGKTSAVISFALSDVGISAGNQVSIKSWSEAESNNWDHYSFDESNGWSSWTPAEI